MKDFFTTILILGVMSIAMILIGGYFFGREGLWMMLIFSMAINFVTYFFSDKIAIASNKAKPLSREMGPEIYASVEKLTEKMGLPMPALYYTEAMQANAFATGRSPKKSAVVVTAGLLNVLNHAELEGVLAHELGHIKNRDILTATVASVMASVLSFTARMRTVSRERSSLIDLLIMITVPIGALLLQMALSRNREYEADETAAEAIGDGDPLADALLKISDSVSRTDMNVNPSFSSLYILNPFTRGSKVANLFSTHPPVGERVARLRAM